MEGPDVLSKWDRTIVAFIASIFSSVKQIYKLLLQILTAKNKNEADKIGEQNENLGLGIGQEGKKAGEEDKP